MDPTRTKHIVEACLLVAGAPLGVPQLEALFEQDADRPTRDAIREALGALARDYEGRGIELVEVAGGWRLQSRVDMQPWTQRLFREKTPRYSRALLETLVLVAYRQPITRGEIEEVRGVAVSSNIVRTLQERQWVREIGYKDVPGKPALLGTTRQFLDYFNLKRLEDLPTLGALKDLDAFDAVLAGTGLVDGVDGAAANDAGAEGTSSADATDVPNGQGAADAGDVPRDPDAPDAPDAADAADAADEASTEDAEDGREVGPHAVGSAARPGAGADADDIVAAEGETVPGARDDPDRSRDEAAADTAPDVGPDVGPDAAPDTVPDAAPDTAPDTAPDVASDVGPDPLRTDLEERGSLHGEPGERAREDPLEAFRRVVGRAVDRFAEEGHDDLALRAPVAGVRPVGDVRRASEASSETVPAEPPDRKDRVP